MIFQASEQQFCQTSFPPPLAFPSTYYFPPTSSLCFLFYLHVFIDSFSRFSICFTSIQWHFSQSKRTVNFHLLSLVNCGLRILYFLWCLLDRMGFFSSVLSVSLAIVSLFKSTGKKRRRKKTTQVLHMSYYGLIMSVMPAPYDRSTVFGPGPRIALQTMCRKQCLHSHSVSVGKLL